MRYCLAILLIVWTTGASARRCEHESVYLREAAAVFVGRLVTFHTNVDRSEILLHYQVLEELKGQVPEEVLILDYPPCMFSLCTPEEVRRAQEARGETDKPEIVLIYPAPKHPAFYRAWGLKPGDVHGEKRHCAWVHLNRSVGLKSWERDLARVRRQIDR